MSQLKSMTQLKWQPVFTYIAIVLLMKLLAYLVNLLCVFSVSANLHRQCSQGHSTKGHQEEDGGSRNPPYTGR